MKKILALALALAMVFTLAACGNDPAPSDSVDEPTTDEVVSTPETPETPDEPEEPAVDYSKLAGTYNYYEDKGSMGVMPWTIELGADGSCTVTEHNSHIGDQVKVCDGWVDNGDGTFTTGAWESVDGPAPDFIDEVGRITWEIAGEGICQPVNGAPSADPSLANESIAGTYKYYEDKGSMGVMPWTIELGKDGSCTVTEHNSHIGDQVHVAAEWKDNGNGTFFTGAWDSTDGPAPDFIAEDGSVTWEIVGDGICQPVNGTPSADPSLVENTDAPSAPEGDGPEGGSLPVKAGTYTYEEDKGTMGIIPWVVVINEDGTATVTEHNPHMGEKHHVCSGWTENDDGSFTTGAWDNADGPKSDFFAEDGTCSWRITSPSTCEPVV